MCVLEVGLFLSNTILYGTTILLIHNTWRGALDEMEQSPCVSECRFFPLSPGPWQLLRHFLWTLGPQDTRFEINAPNHFTSYITAYIYIRNHLQWQLFSWSRSDSPSRGEFSICFCWLTLLLLSIMKMSSHNASHLSFLSQSHSKSGPVELSHHHSVM